MSPTFNDGATCTSLEAYKAMFLFWHDIYMRSHNEEIGDMLSGMQLVKSDLSTADPAFVREWQKCLQQACQGTRDKDIFLVLGK